MQQTVEQPTCVLEWEPFTAVVAVLLAQSRRRQSSLSLLMLALDEVSPEAEEAAAPTVARFLQEVARDGDIIGRRPGVGFGLLLADTSQAGAALLAQRLQSALHIRPIAGSPNAATLSVGIATWPDTAQNPIELLRQAERALEQAIANGGNRVRLWGWDGPSGWISADRARDWTAARRRAARARLIRACERKWIPRVGIRTQLDACPVCLSTARDEAMGQYISQLPIVGCSGRSGCHCEYASPALPAHPVLPPVEVEQAVNIPRKWRGAALFGSDPRQRCRPEELVAYFDSYPLLYMRMSFDLAADEVAYLVRPATQAWEQPGGLTGTLQGVEVPVELPFGPWLKRVHKAPDFPAKAQQRARAGTLCLTNRRIFFSDGAAVNSLPLLQVTDVEWFGNGVALRAEGWTPRLVFLVSDPLSISLYIARVLRAELLLC